MPPTLNPDRTAVMQTGMLLGVSVYDGTLTPPHVTAVGSMPTVTVNGVGHTATSAIWFTPDQPLPMCLVAYNLPVAVAPGDDVLLTIAPGQLTTSAGDLVVTGQAVRNLAGADYLPDAPPPGRRMRLGWMCDSGAPYRPTPMYANLVKTGPADWEDSDGNGTDWGTIRPADGMPTNVGTGFLGKRVLYPYSDGVNPSYYTVSEPGHYWLFCDGTGDTYLTYRGYQDADHPNVLTQYDGGNAGEHVHTGTTDNRRGYDLVMTNSPAGGPGAMDISVLIYAPGGQTITNVRLYGPEVADPFDPPKFHPSFMEQMRGTKLWRDKDAIGIDGSCTIGDYEDYPLPTWAGWGTVRNDPSQSIPVTHAAAYNGGAGGKYARDASYFHSIVLTTGVSLSTRYPGGFPDGASRKLVFPNPGSRPPKYVNSIPATMSDSTTGSLAFTGMCYKLDDTHILCFVIDYDTAGPFLAGRDLPDGSLLCLYGHGIPLSDGVELVNLLPECDYYHCVPPAATDACVRSEARMFAANLATDRTLIVEYANEACFNYDTAYQQWYHCYITGHEFALARGVLGDADWLYGFNLRWYAQRTAQCARIYREEWASAGRDPAKLQIVLGSQLADASKLSFMLQHMAVYDADGLRPSDLGYAGPCLPYLDGVVVAPYSSVFPAKLPGWPAIGIDDAVFDAMTLEAKMDYAEFYFGHLDVGLLAGWMKANVDSIAANAPGLFLGTYEGGPATWHTGGSTIALDTVAGSLHPRSRKMFLALLALVESYGTRFFTKNGLAGDFVVETSGSGGQTTAYSAFNGATQRRGRGDGLDGLADNRPLITDGDGKAKPVANFRATVSPVGLGFQQYAARRARVRVSTLGGRLTIGVEV